MALYINYAYGYFSKKTNSQNNTKPLGFHILFLRFFFFFIFLTQHEWSCFKHEKISFFLDLHKSVVRLKVIIKLWQCFAK